MVNQMNKDEIRKHMIEHRNMLDDEGVMNNTSLMLSNFLNSHIIDYSCPLFYMFAPVNNEPDMFYIHDRLLDLYRINTDFEPVFCYPMCDLDNSILHDDNYVRPVMHFYGVDDRCTMKPGYMGIPEPTRTGEQYTVKAISKRLEITNSSAIMFMPGLAFDIKGNRIGYGGGYYDRYLNHHDIKTKIAICYDFQVVEDLSELSTSKDNRVDYIITEKRVIKISVVKK